VVKVLVGKKKGERFPGFWAEFEGEVVSSYEDIRGEKHIVYTLYRCTAYRYEAYRVHIADESNPGNPVYELLPYDPHNTMESGLGLDYSDPWGKAQIVARYPLFLKDMDYFQERNVDVSPSPW
jgi:hypothetical protein